MTNLNELDDDVPADAYAAWAVEYEFNLRYDRWKRERVREIQVTFVAAAGRFQDALRRTAVSAEAFTRAMSGRVRT